MLLKFNVTTEDETNILNILHVMQTNTQLTVTENAHFQQVT